MNKNNKKWLDFYLFSIEVGVSSKGTSGASEGEHGERHWDGNIDSNLEGNIDTKLLNLHSDNGRSTNKANILQN